jgi:AcrR family transcriptional regulator
VQRQRSEATRERVIRAAIACIAEEGFRRATTSRIAERASVSRGALQHQFGGRGALLEVILERVLEDFGVQLRGFSTRATSPEARVRALVGASWDLVREPTYHAYREILRNHPLRGVGPLEPERIIRQITDALDAILPDLFADLAPSKSTVVLVSVVLFATLNGIAEQQLLVDYPPSLTRRQLAVLRETILRLLSR